MNDTEQLQEDLRGLRRRRTPLMVAVLANVVLSIGFLGVPYYRGLLRARAARVNFGRFAACLYGGAPVTAGGLSLPVGDRMRLANRLLSEPGDWLPACVTRLQTVAPPAAIFIWPRIKTAESALRGAVTRLTAELQDLEQSASHLQAIPERPLQRIEKLRSALTLYAQAAGQEDGLERNAIRFEAAPQDAPPTRLPLMAAQGAPLRTWERRGHLEALAADARGLSWLRLDAGVERRRPPRTHTVRDALVFAGVPYILWATPEARCATLEDRCTHRALGIARYDTESDVLPKPLWLSGHPAGRIDRHIRRTKTHLSLIARTENPNTLHIRHFTLTSLSGLLKNAPHKEGEAHPTGPQAPNSQSPAPDTEAEAGTAGPADDTSMDASEDGGAQAEPTREKPATVRPAEATKQPIPPADSSEYTLPGPVLDSLLLPEHPGAQALVISAGAQEGSSAQPVQVLLLHGESQTGLAEWVAPAGPATSVWSQACAAGSNLYLAFGNRGHLQLAVVTADGAVALGEPQTVDLPDGVLSDESPQKDRVLLRCSSEHAALVYVDSERGLWSQHCNGAGRCRRPERIARQAATLAATFAQNDLWIAFSETANSQLLLTRNGGPAVAPSPCFSPRSGFCGQASLLVLADDLVVTARDRYDLLAVSRAPEANAFVPLPGLVVEPAQPNDNRAMHQHLLRKGLRRP